MNRIRIGRPRAQRLSPDPPDPHIGRPTGARAVTMAHHEQVRMWECILLTSGAAPLTAAGPLRWVRSLDGDRLAGSHLPAQDRAGTWR